MWAAGAAQKCLALRALYGCAADASLDSRDKLENDMMRVCRACPENPSAAQADEGTDSAAQAAYALLKGGAARPPNLQSPAILYYTFQYYKNRE
jgi:hypothetical protein